MFLTIKIEMQLLIYNLCRPVPSLPGVLAIPTATGKELSKQKDSFFTKSIISAASALVNVKWK